MTIITDERCLAYSSPGHPERPARISSTLALLRQQQEVPLSWSEPLPVSDDTLALAHTPAHIELVKSAAYDFDADTPAHPEIDAHARRSVGGAIHAMRLARQGEPAFNLLRPPGHHATRDRAMGFCYLNNIAISVLTAQAEGLERIAVFDFDVHHGNGTEAILLNNEGVIFSSVHQWPCFPGTGTENVGRNCFNYPAAPNTPRNAYRDLLSGALDKVLAFKPQLLAVSAGFDCYAGDPLAQETLEMEDFHWLGEILRQSDVPSYHVLEGGYSDDLPELILAYLKGLQAAPGCH